MSDDWASLQARWRKEQARTRFRRRFLLYLLSFLVCMVLLVPMWLRGQEWGLALLLSAGGGWVGLFLLNAFFATWINSEDDGFTPPFA